MVFAHLVHTQLEPLLEFLCSLPGPTGKPALEFVMAEWTSRQHLFYGQYEGKVRWADARPRPPRCQAPPRGWAATTALKCPDCRLLARAPPRPRLSAAAGFLCL